MWLNHRCWFWAAELGIYVCLNTWLLTKKQCFNPPQRTQNTGEVGLKHFQNANSTEETKTAGYDGTACGEIVPNKISRTDATASPGGNNQENPETEQEAKKQLAYEEKKKQWYQRGVEYWDNAVIQFLPIPLIRAIQSS